MSTLLLHHFLDASAAVQPDAEAVVDGGRVLTYAELARLANQTAQLLVSIGVEPGDRVGLYLEKSLESIIALFATLKAGAVYVPLDHHAPSGRLGFMASDCGIATLLTRQAQSSTWPDLVAAGAPLERVVVLDGDGDGDSNVAPDGVEVLGQSAVIGEAPTPPPVAGIDLDPAYILYTSGSTGQPKGVMLSHRNALTFVEWAVRRFSIGPSDRLSSHAPLHFDLSVFDVFAACASGATLVLVPPQVSVLPREAVRFIEGNSITVWYSVPSILSMIALRGGLRPGDLPSLRTILFAGEVLPPKYLRMLMEALPRAEFHNLYGPTETNVCTHHHVESAPEGDAEVPIGRAIDGVEVFALTDDGRRAQPGEAGELYVRGSTVTGGYWGDPERSAQVLVADPLGRPVTDLAYRTGDLVRQGDEGEVSFLGRRDTQVKSRGYRIELGEIEAALLTHSSVLECAVVAVPDELVTNRIVAYVAVSEPLERAELVHTCATRVPRYMIPEAFEQLEQLPKTSTGKIDRQALARPKERTDTT